MSVAAAFSSALSGLGAAARQAEVLSSNVANAATPGYARREVALTVRDVAGTGQGVRVAAILRDVDLHLLNDRRRAEAGSAAADSRAAFLNRLEDIHGDSDSPGSLTGRINALDSALITAASQPQSEAGLAAAVTAAGALADALNAATDAVQAERLAADRAIAAGVDRINTALQQIRDLNVEIAAFGGAGRDPSSLMDQRAQIVDGIAGLLPLREVQRDNGQIALFTTGGAVLLEGNPATLGFTPANGMVAEMTLAAGALSGLTLNGQPLATSGPASRIQGGELAALFSLRDDLGTRAQSGLDALARDLVERFSQSGLDPTLAPGAPGLFTDAGLALDPAQNTGLAGRIALNSAVDPAAGGSVTRLRDGLAAAIAGPAGAAALLNAWSGALQAQRPVAGGIPAGQYSAGGLAAELLSGVATARLSAETEQSYNGARLSALQDMQAEQGVDVDAEMQSLLVIEKNYAANARVIQALDEMLQSLLGI